MAAEGGLPGLSADLLSVDEGKHDEGKHGS